MIDDDTISARLSSQQGNAASFGSDGGLYVPTSTPGPTYTQGNGITISGTQIAARMSTQSGNQARFGTDGGIYVPKSSTSIPIATTYSLGGIVVDRGLTIDGDGYCGITNLLSNSFIYEYRAQQEFGGETEIRLGNLWDENIFERPLIAMWVQISRPSTTSNVSASFGDYAIISDRPLGLNSSVRSTAALYWAAGNDQMYRVIGDTGPGSRSSSVKFTSSSGSGTAMLRIMAFGMNNDGIG